MKSFVGFVVLMAIAFGAHAQKQGIKGKVFWLAGDQMPGPERAKAPQQGIIREILIYEAVTLQQTTQQNGFFSDIKTRLVAKTKSSQDGSFRVKLPPGQYSVFTQEPKGLFANLFDGQGRINTVTVKPKEFAWITITVDYAAAY
ncbi:MAG: carboxypeptidase regulatory-like domain-containing protein [Bacteroidota bacterium]